MPHAPTMCAHSPTSPLESVLLDRLILAQEPTHVEPAHSARSKCVSTVLQAALPMETQLGARQPLETTKSFAMPFLPTSALPALLAPSTLALMLPAHAQPLRPHAQLPTFVRLPHAILPLDACTHL